MERNAAHEPGREAGQGDTVAERRVYVRGCIYQARGDLDLALADLDNAVQLCPANLDAFIARARVRHEKGEHRLALEDIETALRLGPGNCEAIYVRGLVYQARINPLGMSSTP